MGSVVTNPGNLITFSVLFSLTQNMGALLGSSLLGTWQVTREKFHSSNLAEQLSSLDPLVATRIQRSAAAYGSVLLDPAARTRQGISVLSQTTTREANILAFNDVFLMIAAIATLLAAWIFGRALWLMYIAPPPAPAAPAPQASAASDDSPPPTDSPIATAEGTPPDPVPAEGVPDYHETHR
jgi:hypothetical protein